MRALPSGRAAGPACRPLSFPQPADAHSIARKAPDQWPTTWPRKSRTRSSDRSVRGFLGIDDHLGVFFALGRLDDDVGHVVAAVLRGVVRAAAVVVRSEEHTSELQSQSN